MSSQFTISSLNCNQNLNDSTIQKFALFFDSADILLLQECNTDNISLVASYGFEMIAYSNPSLIKRMSHQARDIKWIPHDEPIDNSDPGFNTQSRYYFKKDTAHVMFARERRKAGILYHAAIPRGITFCELTSPCHTYKVVLCGVYLGAKQDKTFKLSELSAVRSVAQRIRQAGKIPMICGDFNALFDRSRPDYYAYGYQSIAWYPEYNSALGYVYKQMTPVRDDLPYLYDPMPEMNCSAIKHTIHHQFGYFRPDYTLVDINNNYFAKGQSILQFEIIDVIGSGCTDHNMIRLKVVLQWP